MSELSLHPRQIRKGQDVSLLSKDGQRIDRKKFKEIFTVLRQHSRLRQTSLADALGITSSTVSFWESGKRTPRSRNLVEQIATILNATAEEKAALLHAAGFYETPPLLDVVEELRTVLLDPNIADNGKEELVKIINTCISLVRRPSAPTSRS